MGCGSLLQDEEVKVGRKHVTKEVVSNVDQVLAGDVQVECSECGSWCTLEAVGIMDASKSEVDSMEVFCMKCMHKQHSKLKAELIACIERVNWLEGTVRNLISSQKMDNTVLVSSPKRSNNRSKPAPKRKEPFIEDLSSVSNSNERSFAEVVASTPLIAGTDKVDDTVSSSVSVDEIGADGPPENSNDESLPPQNDIKNNEGFKVVQRSRKKKCIKIVGDSMMKNISRIVRCDKKGSGCFSKRSAGIKEIAEKATEEALCAEDGSLVVIQGGGNSLKHIGVKETISSIVNYMKRVQCERKDLKIAAASNMPHPCENSHYEVWRKAVNVELQKEVCRISMEIAQKETGRVSFLDMNFVLDPQLFARDAVHLNTEGEARVGKRILTWLKEKERVIRLADE